MRRFRLTLEYDGSDFQGWQFQPDVRTVQAVVEAAISEVTGEQRRIQAAGRTDAGVHAWGQVAHFDAATHLSAIELQRALNAVLPRDVAAREVREVASDFDARRDAVAKRYVYRILRRASPSPLRRRYCWHIRGPLDLAAMRAAADELKGSHDFAALRGAPGGPSVSEETQRTLDQLELLSDGDEVRIRAEARSFLRYMVRNLVGTLVEVGQGRLTVARIPEILESRDRSQAGPTAPAHGLCLEVIRYPGSA
jgi:tRNA pseudouridine38-40 synthase